MIDGNILLEQLLNSPETSGSLISRGQPLAGRGHQPSGSKAIDPLKSIQAQSVLVVDDSATMRRTLALTLEKAGYRVMSAKDGRGSTGTIAAEFEHPTGDL